MHRLDMAPIDVGWVDTAMLALIAFSVLFGLLRGLVLELMSLAGWFAAWFAALRFGPWLAFHLGFGEPASALNRGLAYAAVFIVVLIVSGLLARGVSAIVGATPLRPLDRLLGAFFGVLRAALALAVMVTLLEFTPVARSDAWRGSRGVLAVNAALGLLLPRLAPDTDGDGEPAGQPV